MTAVVRAVAPRSVVLVAGIVVALLGAGAVTYGVLDGDVPAGDDAVEAVPRADARPGLLLGGLLVAVVGLVLVYRATG